MTSPPLFRQAPRPEGGTAARRLECVIAGIFFGAGRRIGRCRRVIAATKIAVQSGHEVGTRRASGQRRTRLFTEIDPPLKAISEKDHETYATEGVLVLRRAFAETRIAALLEGVERMIDKGLAGECALDWIDRERRLPSRTGHLLHPDKYHPAFANWIDEDLAPHLETLISGPGVRHSLFGMLAAAGGQPYTQKWHRDLCRPGDADETAFLRRHDGQLRAIQRPARSR